MTEFLSAVPWADVPWVLSGLVLAVFLMSAFEVDEFTRTSDLDTYGVYWRRVVTNGMTFLPMLLVAHLVSSASWRLDHPHWFTGLLAVGAGVGVCALICGLIALTPVQKWLDQMRLAAKARRARLESSVGS